MLQHKNSRPWQKREKSRSLLTTHELNAESPLTFTTGRDRGIVSPQAQMLLCVFTVIIIPTPEPLVLTTPWDARFSIHTWRHERDLALSPVNRYPHTKTLKRLLFFARLKKVNFFFKQHKKARTDIVLVCLWVRLCGKTVTGRAQPSATPRKRSWPSLEGPKRHENSGPASLQNTTAPSHRKRIS